MWRLTFLLISIISIGTVFSDETDIYGKDGIEVEYPNPPDNPVFTKPCFDGLGCFDTGPPWFHPVYRPNIVEPANDTLTLYYLYTPSNPNDTYNLEPTEESLKNSTFDDTVPLIVLIHGYGDGDFPIYTEIKNEFFILGNFNVIIVNWTHDNGPPGPQAFANCRLTGAKVAQLINFIIKNTNLKAEDVDVIGHSFGGEMTGFVGERIPNLGRIISLDPGGPFFHHAPPEVHIDRTDALFVQIVHVNGGPDIYGGVGLDEPYGDMDVFPNGGNHQPGCDYEQFVKLPVAKGQPIANSCSHDRALDFIKQSINNCNYTAYAATSYSAFKDKQYKAQNRMGYHATKPDIPLLFFLDTDSKEPYCEICPNKDKEN